MRAEAMNLNEMMSKLDRWCPYIIMLLLWFILWPVRILVLVLLPADSVYEWHPLHKVYEFWAFGK